MLIASLVAQETKGDDKSPDPVLTSYDFKDKEDPAEHPALLNPSPITVTDQPPKKKRSRKGSSSFNKNPQGRRHGPVWVLISPNSWKRNPHQSHQRKPSIILAQWNKVDCCALPEQNMHNWTGISR